MWKQLKRVIKPNGAIVLFGSEPFSSALRMSNLKNYKYDWVWEKSKATGHLNSKKRPLVKHELVHVFYKTQPTYNPQGLLAKEKPTVSRGDRGKKGEGSSGDVYGKAVRDAIQTHTNYPLSVIKFNVDMKAEFHPTQKPVALMEYLIKTYTNEGETVLDFAAGSFTTGVACVKTGRNFIGIEMDKGYFYVGVNRVKEVINWPQSKTELVIDTGDC